MSHGKRPCLEAARNFSEWSANNAARGVEEFLDETAMRADDKAQEGGLQRHVAAKLIDR